MAKRILSEFPWLEASLIAFNGSGYADRTNSETFMNSYFAYQQFKKRIYGMQMADKYWQSGLRVADYLLKTSAGAGRVPGRSSLRQFAKFYPLAY